MVKMKYRLRLVAICSILFIFFVSYKILQPVIEERPNLDIDAGADHAAGIDVGNNDFPGGDFEGESHQARNVKSKGGQFYWEEFNKTKKAITEQLLSLYDVDWDYKLTEDPWEMAAVWVKSRRITPNQATELGGILKHMANSKILAADVGYKGTQLKVSLVLDGDQRVAFKPQWFERDHVIDGIFAGADRHNGEIASFHLNRLLGLNRSPLVVGRTIDLKTDIIPVAAERLLKTFYKKDNNTCFYGKCMYCKGPETGVCARGTRMEGAIVLWLPAEWKFTTWRHPWQRSYVEGKRKRWEYDNDYCDDVMKDTKLTEGPLLMDMIDAAVFDFLVGNADRHHFETFKDHPDSMLVMLDNGKTFGNPYHDEQSILAPLYQCCKMRVNLYERLQTLQDGILSTVLRKLLAKDPISPVLHEKYYEAMDRRLKYVLKVVNSCVLQDGEDNVFVKDTYEKDSS